MPITTVAKRLAIAIGAYRAARWVARKIRPGQAREFAGDVNLYRSLIKRDALCFDIGANVGDKSEALLAAGARVVAFEPNPIVLPELRARCSHDPRWSLVIAALGSKSAVLTLHASDAIGESSLHADWHRVTIASFPVPVISLDAAIAAFGVPDFCKVDVEGWEPEVFRGLSQSIPLITFEFHLNERHIPKTQDCLALLSKLGEYEVNVARAEQTTLLLDKWIPLVEFSPSFPGNLADLMKGDRYGDLILRAVAR